MIVVVVSVDWEGRSLLPENLKLMEDFRRRHPDIPLQHFLNAAYYTRSQGDLRQTTRAISEVLLPGDEHGLHIHAWHSLLQVARVRERCSPRFLDADAPVPKAPDDWGFYPDEDGYDVPLEHFDPVELDRIIQASIEILTARGFRRPTAFRAGGWMSGPKVRDALVRNGFELDCSAVDPQLTIKRFGDIPLARWLSDLWPSIDAVSQPYRIATTAGTLWQVPNNAGLVDYTPTDDLMSIFEQNVARARATSASNWIVSTGFHQETARKFLDRLDRGIEDFRRVADEQRIPLIFTANPQQFIEGFPG